MKISTELDINMTVNPRWDVLGIGSMAVDDLVFLPKYPEQDTKNEISHSERHGGGLTATALVAAVRLGARAAFAGVLGTDDLSKWAEDDLARDGVDVSLVVHHPDAKVIHAVIIVEQEQHSRTILYQLNGRAGADDELPSAEVIQAAGVLFVDDFGVKGNLRAVGIARAADVPVVADFEREPPMNLINMVDHLIVGARFAQRVTGAASPEAAARALWHSEHAAVVVTMGEAGAWMLDARGELQHQPAFPVQAVDTTGCGDVFHGAYAWGLTRGLDLGARVRIASAAAALKATQPGGRKGIPTLAQVEAFLAAQT
jgi:sulfofructose kinase